MNTLMKSIPGDKHSRLLYFLFANGVYDKKNNEVIIHGTQADIARLSGMKQSSVGRALSELSKAGYCTKKVRGHYVLHEKK